MDHFSVVDEERSNPVLLLNRMKSVSAVAAAVLALVHEDFADRRNLGARPGWLAILHRFKILEVLAVQHIEQLFESVVMREDVTFKFSSDFVCERFSYLNINRVEPFNFSTYIDQSLESDSLNGT